MENHRDLIYGTHLNSLAIAKVHNLCEMAKEYDLYFLHKEAKCLLASLRKTPRHSFGMLGVGIDMLYSANKILGLYKVFTILRLQQQELPL